MGTVQARVTDDLKKESERVLSNLGMDSATAIRVFLKKVVATKSIPFSLEEEYSFTEEEENEIIKNQQDSDEVRRTRSPVEAQEFLDSLK